MQRVLTKDLNARLKVGVVKDYPLSTWKSIAESVGKKLDTFSKPLSELTNTIKGKQK